MRLFEKNGRFSKTAFWFSLFMALAFAFSLAVSVRVALLPDDLFAEVAASITGLLAGLTSMAAMIYSWGKKLDRKS